MPKPHWHIVIGRSQGVGGAAVEEDEAKIGTRSVKGISLVSLYYPSKLTGREKALLNVLQRNLVLSCLLGLKVEAAVRPQAELG